MSNKQISITLKPWPELYFLDPVTGELPKNYKPKSKVRPSTIDCGPQSQSSSTKKRISVKLKRMPELQFLDPVTGECPKNVNELINAKKAHTLKLNTTRDNLSNENLYNFVSNILEKRPPKRASGVKRRTSKNLGFKVSKLESTDTLSTSTSYSDNGHNSPYTKKKVIRKALFRNDGRGSFRKNANMNGQASKIEMPVRNKIDETLPLLDIDQTEQMLLKPKQKLASTVTNTFRIPTTVPLRKVKVEKKSPKLSVGSLEEFLQFEQQCKTPKSQRKTSGSNKVDLSVYVEKIVKKINENEQLYEKMGKNMSDIKHNLDIILNHPNMKGVKLVTHSENLISFDDTENIAPNEKETPDRKAHGENLRIATLQKGIQKKVLFNLHVGSPAKCTNSLSTITTSVNTPNTMCRMIKRKAEDQYLNLKDTPKLRR